jgi:putative alpha-1,2-mannosidase
MMILILSGPKDGNMEQGAQPRKGWGRNGRSDPTFYTTLWRTLLFPRKFYEFDENGNMMHYSPYNGEVLPGYMFTDNGFWDTFRAVFPFFNLMYPSMNEKMQAGLVNTYLQSGFLPEWASPGHRSVMIGNNSATTIVLMHILKEDGTMTLKRFTRVFCTALKMYIPG